MEIKVLHQVMDWNEDVSEEVKGTLAAHHICMINVMGSPGAGKTSLITSLIDSLKEDFRVGVIEGDIAGQVDAAAIWSPLTVTVSDTLGDKAVVVSSIGDFADKAPSPGSWITSAKMIKEHPEVIEALTKAFLKASNFRAANIEKTAEYVARLIGTDSKPGFKKGTGIDKREKAGNTRRKIIYSAWNQRNTRGGN